MEHGHSATLLSNNFTRSEGISLQRQAQVSNAAAHSAVMLSTRVSFHEATVIPSPYSVCSCLMRRCCLAGDLFYSLTAKTTMFSCSLLKMPVQVTLSSSGAWIFQIATTTFIHLISLKTCKQLLLVTGTRTTA